ncbi:MAG: GMC family oxidoreductase [Opitutia bacterium Tous-C4FEB]|nr:MAG: GMC family oxidoreductase [Opitutae bacterium Tous-C5TDCM]PAW91236.1 MAG: GMC family oxidoreductase [Opitutae bacterium Tous-C4FEB]
MPIITSDKTQPTYDVIVVGSGAAGGQTAYTLTMEGLKVLMIESGRNYDPVKETPMFQTDGQAPLRAANTPDKPMGFYDSTVDGGWAVPGEPYTNASADPTRQFTWWRARMLGGRTNHWGRISLRNGPYDFKPHRRDGLGFDWPIGYDDVAPYYDKVEMLVGVYGSNTGLENTPDSSPGVLLPPPKARAGELLAQQRAKKLGLPVVPIHRAVLSVRQDADAIPAKLHPGNPKAQRLLAESMRSRAACFWATECGRGCATKANYQSTTVHLPPALASGNLDILTDAMVREVTLNAAGKATGVIHVDKKTGAEGRATARVVVLAASSCDSVRILLNSKSARFPQGLANSSGVVGKYIMDTVGAALGGHIPLLENLPVHNEDGAGGAHVYIPWWLYGEQLAGKLDFARGYHVEFSTGRRMPNVTTGANLEHLTGGSFGRQFKEDARRYYGASVSFASRGEMIPNENCFCELDPVVKDKWGVPALRFHWQWSDHELRQVAHAQKTFAQLIEAMGGKVRQPPAANPLTAIRPGGNVKHEVGGARMGDSPKTSVTNSFGQTWDVPNLFLGDGATFCSNADKNPTLTIMALAWRMGDYLIGEMKKGNV